MTVSENVPLTKEDIASALRVAANNVLAEKSSVVLIEVPIGHAQAHRYIHLGAGALQEAVMLARALNHALDAVLNATWTTLTGGRL